MNANPILLATLCATFVAVGPAVRAQSSSAAAAGPKDTQVLKIATPIEEVVQLNQSGVGDGVILSYIQNSDRTYRLSAQDIIKLRDAGVSTEVTTALIRRGAEQRQVAEPASVETVAAAPTYQAAPAPTVMAVPAPVTYYEVPRSTVSVTYFGTPRYNNYYYPSSYYPRYRSYSYSPGYCYTPRLTVGFGSRGCAGPASFRSSARFCR